MTTEKRMIYMEDAYEAVIDLSGQADTKSAYAAFWKAGKEIQKLPAVEAVVLPCKVRDSVWLIQWWNGFKIKNLTHPMQRTILHYDIRTDGLFAHFYDGCISTKYFGKIVFLTCEEAKKALAKMDGDK